MNGPLSRGDGGHKASTRPSGKDEDPRSPSTKPPDLPAWTLVQAAHLAGRRFHEVFASQGLSAHQFGVLVALSRCPGISQGALARQILVTPQSIGEILTQMVTAGLIDRTSPARRGVAISVRITPHGRTTLQQTYPLVEAINTPTALGLNHQEAHTLNELLQRVHDHLDDRPFQPLRNGV